MKRRGPDSLEGLFIAVLCCLICTLMYGSAAGLSSMLFVACINRYDTDRNKASLPFTLCNVLQAVSGPFSGYLAKRFSVRAVVLVGAVLAPLGIGVCYLAEDITAVTVFWGIIFGIGFGLSSLLLPAIINDYFVKQRSTALGLCYFGGPLGFLIFPPIFEVLLDKYGLSGTFLLLSGINMHCLPLSMLLRQRNFKAKDEQSHLSSKKVVDSYLSIDCGTPQKIDYSGASSELKNHCRRFSIEFLWNRYGSKEFLTQQYTLSLNKNWADKSHTNGGAWRSFRNCSKNRYENVDTLVKTSEENGHLDCLEGNNPFAYQNHDPSYTEVAMIPADNLVRKSRTCQNVDFTKDNRYEECSTIYFGTVKSAPNFVVGELKVKNSTCSNAAEYTSNGYVTSNVSNHSSGKVSSNPILLNYKMLDENSNSPCCTSYGEDVIRKQSMEKTAKAPSSSLASMYFNPIFILICVINAISSLHFTTLTTVIIDFSRDLKIDMEYEKYIMMCLSIAGGVGMLGFGWVTDGGYLTRTRFGSLSQLIGSIATALLPLTVGFKTVMITLAAWCTCQASFIPIIPAIIAEYIAEDIQAVAVSACFVLCGPLYLIIPPLIGYFRDEKGSYDNIFFLLGGLSFVNCIAVFTIPFIARWRSKK